jgi:hypothetical protein
MNAHANVWRKAEIYRSPLKESEQRAPTAAEAPPRWHGDGFARDQIQGLVRRVFLSSGEGTARQVIFSAAEPDLDVGGICDAVAQSLSLETTSPIAWLASPLTGESGYDHAKGDRSIKSCSVRLAHNLWRVPVAQLGRSHCAGSFPFHWPLFLAALKNEFEFAVIHGPSAALSTEAAFLGQLTDGIILILGANSTRKTAALNIKKTFQGARSRVIGTVLSGRTFPIPEKLYRRL